MSTIWKCVWQGPATMMCMWWDLNRGLTHPWRCTFGGNLIEGLHIHGDVWRGPHKILVKLPNSRNQVGGKSKTFPNSGIMDLPPNGLLSDIPFRVIHLPQSTKLVFHLLSLCYANSQTT
eukprot:TRINITY_DN70265_c0_g1_i1.p1 TRINITY_DN70265_c0_g1~~TRINITY_DN70265_c0_g1_i1.p1  ORF type:complete len:119 (-),score=7.45 TRINITY_DN70265_c0_g1_i1:183-539(-)